MRSLRANNLFTSPRNNRARSPRDDSDSSYKPAPPWCYVGHAQPPIPPPSTHQASEWEAGHSEHNIREMVCVKCLGRACGGKPAREKKPTRWNVVYTDTGAYFPMSLASRVFSGEGVAFTGRFKYMPWLSFDSGRSKTWSRRFCCSRPRTTGNKIHVLSLKHTG
jgi:hypothetical protein